ncbi:hypothetical protein D3C81_109410 [compost metagenome]
MNNWCSAHIAAIGFLSLSVAAAPQAELTFTAVGEPPPCHIVQVPGTLDYGNINRNQLAAKKPTQLPVKTFVGGITVQCEAKTSIGLSAVDNSGGNALSTGNLQWNSPKVMVTPAQTDQRFGLGMTQGGNAIGVWNVVFHSAQVDGVSTQTGVASNGILDFADTAPTMRNNGKVTTWIQNNAIATGEIFTIQADAAVTIAPLEDLPSGSKISFAGSATLEIIYL